MGVGIRLWTASRKLSGRLGGWQRRLFSDLSRAGYWDACGRLLSRWGKPGRALRWYRKATALDGGNQRIWRRRAAAAMRSADLEEAALCYRALVRLEPKNPRAYWRLAAVYELIGSTRAALEVCQHGLRRAPGAACLHRQYAHLLLGSGAVGSALRAFERAAELSPSHCDTHYYIGLALRRAGRVEEARRALRRALAMRPDDPKLYYALGICCQADIEAEESVGLLLRRLVAEQRAGDLDRGEMGDLPT